MRSLDIMFFLVLAAFTIWYLSSIYLYTLVFLGNPHVHVGLDGDEGDGSVELPVVVGEGVGSVGLLILVGEGGSDSELLVTFVLDQALLLCLDHTSECITKYELEILYLKA
jgi:hypothetical protein